MGAERGIGLNMSSRETKATEFIKSNFQTVWPVHLAGFTRLLLHLRHRFDGDLDLALILAVIGSRTHNERWTPELEELARMTSAEAGDIIQHPINIQSVADFSGIPRETVRRKVATLREKGWVAREADGRLTVTRNAASDLEDATGVTIAYLGALLTVFEAVRNDDGEREYG